MDDRQGRPDHGSAGGRDHGPHRQGPRRALPRARGGVRRVLLHAYRRAGHARAEGTPAEAVGRGHQGRDARRRADHRQADPCPRQQRGDRRVEDRDGERVVRGSAVGHGEHVQDLRGELQGRDAPGRARERGPGARHHRARRPPMSPPPFPAEYRASGVLLHVTSLPSPYGIGDVGPAAVAWVDRLHEASQCWWQALPLGPTGYGDSPYQSLSSFAGNPLLISPDWLIEDELVKPSDWAGGPLSATAVDFDAVKRFKYALLEAAWKSFGTGARSDLHPDFERFGQEKAHWLDDYALFSALKARYGGASYLEWPEELVRRAPAAPAQAARDARDQTAPVRLGQ